MPGLSLRFQRWWRQGDASLAEFWIYASGQKLASAVVVLPWEVQVTALTGPWAVAKKDETAAAADLLDAVLRFGVQRIAAQLRQVDVARKEIIQVPVAHTDLPTIAKLVAEKTCSYQVWQGRDLYCSAASPKDDEAVGSIGTRTIAPTSRPVCKRCDVPDTDYICSHLLHPLVFGVRQGPLYSRQMLTPPLCDLGRAEIQTPGACHAGGNPCWEYDAEPRQPAKVVPVSPRALPDAFDHFDAIWQLVFKTPLLRIKRAADVAGLTEASSTADEFESRLSDIADVFKAMQVDDDLLPGTKIPKDQSFNRIAALIEQRLQDPERAQAIQALKILRNVAELRVAAQHAHAAEKLPSALSQLGLTFPVSDYGQTWDQVRLKTIDALGALREAVDTLI